MAAQGLLPLAACALEPLAHRAFGDAQSTGDRALLPAFLCQVPGTEAAIFLPIMGLEMGRVLVHTPPSSTFRTTFSNPCSGQ